jgi:hypothetical protein
LELDNAYQKKHDNSLWDSFALISYYHLFVPSDAGGNGFSLERQRRGRWLHVKILALFAVAFRPYGSYLVFFHPAQNGPIESKY